MIVLGKLTEVELQTIMQLMGRKGALEDLFVSLGQQKNVGITADSNQLYERIVSDMQEVKLAITNWWQETAAKYEWSYNATDVWSVNFSTREVSLQSTDMKK